MSRPKTKHWYPKNPKKYMGDPTKIISRSSWETRAMNWLDLNDSVLLWASEEMTVQYYSPIDCKMHRYFPDFLAKMKLKDGSTKTYMIEVKPNKERYPSLSKNKKTFITEMCTYTVNQAKWKAADEFCKSRGIEFIVLDEYDLGIKQRPKQ